MITTYVLVITLLGMTTQSGVAIHSIPGFATYANCQEAGAAYAMPFFKRDKPPPLIIACIEHVARK